VRRHGRGRPPRPRGTDRSDRRRRRGRRSG